MTVDPLPGTSPLRGWSDRLAALPDSVGVLPEPFVAIADLRLDPDGPAGAAVAAYLGVGLPVTPNTWVSGDTTTVIWLGPDEWLVTSPFHAPGELEAGLRTALDGEGAVVDVSAQRLLLTLHGDHVRDVLATGCPLDLHPRVFRTGAAAQAMLGLANVVLLALDDTGTRYQVLVRSTFARYLTAWLLDAATEYTTGTGTTGSVAGEDI